MKCNTVGCEFFTNDKFCSVCARNVMIAKSPEPPMTEDTSHHKSKRCNAVGCGKKVKVCIDCKCGGVFCDEHRLSFAHNCPVDYNRLAKIKLSETNVRVEFNKLEKI